MRKTYLAMVNATIIALTVAIFVLVAISLMV
jgi:hypothetical protein